MSVNPIAIAYLPWANLTDDFSIGPVSFWSFARRAEAMIPDEKMREDLKRFFEIFVDNVGKPVSTIVACSVGEVSYRKFTTEESQSVYRAVDCLVFAAIASGTKNGVCSNNNSIAPPSAERFDLSARWVWPAEGGFAVCTENSVSYWAHGNYRISRPVTVVDGFLGSIDTLIEGLGQVFGPVFPADVRDRLFRSLEWFRYAHSESTAASWPQKVVMMATAFEIFLEFPDFGKKAHFVTEIDRRMRQKNSYLVKITGPKNKEIEVCKAAEWAAQFYGLRNSIVHGEAVSNKDLQFGSWITHLIVADLVLLELIERLLYGHRCIGGEFRSLTAKLVQNSDESAEDFEQALLPSMMGLGFDSVHEALGWIPPSSETSSNIYEM